MEGGPSSYSLPAPCSKEELPDSVSHSKVLEKMAAVFILFPSSKSKRRNRTSFKFQSIWDCKCISCLRESRFLPLGMKPHANFHAIISNEKMLNDIVDIVPKNMGHTSVYFAVTLFTKSLALITLHCNHCLMIQFLHKTMNFLKIVIRICVPGTQQLFN